MKVSNIGLIETKIKKLDEQFPAQDMLLQTGQIDQFASGIYAYGHIPFLVKRNINNIIINTLTKYGCSLINLPLLQPENIWISSGRLERYVNDDVMFRCVTDKGNFCLAPTAEEAVVEFAKSRLTSYKNLPTTYFQIGEKFRNEIRTRGYLLRGKSFEMMDAYSFGKDEIDLNVEYERIKDAYMEIFSELGLNVQPVGADSGAIGGAKSEEFMCVSRIGEDNILYDRITGKLINSELLEKENAKEYIQKTYGITNLNNLEVRKACELGHIFQLGEKYSKSMNASYIAADGKQKYYSMGCYGIGVSRTLAMVYENSLVRNEKNEFSSISLPINITPYSIYIIAKTDDESKLEYAEKMYELLTREGVSVLFDDRDFISIGAKLKDSKVTGIPYTCVLGKTLDEGYVTIENNRFGTKLNVSTDDIVDVLKKFEILRKKKFSIEDIVLQNTKNMNVQQENIVKKK
jgi:proline--tRNA ligase